MHASQILSFLAIAGSALALPAARPDDNVVVVYETVVETAYATAPAGGYGQPTYRPHHSRPAAVTTSKSQPAYTPAPQPQPAKSSAAPAPAPSAPSSGGNDSGYMGVVNEWRQKMGMKALTHDATLEANAAKTCDDGNGQMKHELNPGSMAQVLAPGQPGDFEKCFVGGWLCEKPSLPGLNGICNSMSSGWMYSGTGHADILTSTSYTKIGCSCKKGIWGCDLA